MKKYFYILSLMFFSCNASADAEVFATGTLNFGKFVQIGNSSTIIISVDSQRILNNGAIEALSTNTHSATITTYDSLHYTEGIPGEIKFNQTKQASLGYCSASITNLQFSTTTINTSQNNNVSVGATLNVDGYCKKGLYKGDIDIDYQLTIDGNSANKLVRVPFEFEVEEPLSISKSDSNGVLDFGTYIAPSEDSTVTVNASGVSYTGNVVNVGTKLPTCANMTVSGVSSRVVQMIFDEPSLYLYLNGDSGVSAKLVATNFTVNNDSVSGSGGTSYNFQLPTTNNAQANKNLAVGATLYIPKAAAAGQYSGSVGITFIYNDY